METITELALYLRVLFSKIGEHPCPHCGAVISEDYGEDTDLFITELESETENGDECFEQTISCPHCGKGAKELSASHFSFNKPQGACPTWKGIGMVSLSNVELLIDMPKSVTDLAITGGDQVYIDRYSVSLTNAVKH